MIPYIFLQQILNVYSSSFPSLLAPLSSATKLKPSTYDCNNPKPTNAVTAAPPHRVQIPLSHPRGPCVAINVSFTHIRTHDDVKTPMYRQELLNIVRLGLATYKDDKSITLHIYSWDIMINNCRCGRKCLERN